MAVLFRHAERVRVRMALKVCLGLVVLVEVVLWVGARVVLLEVLL